MLRNCLLSSRCLIVLLLFCICSCGCKDNASNSNKSTVFKVIAQYIDAYERGDKEEIKSLFFIDGAPDDLVEANLDVAYWWCGDHKVVSLSVDKYQGPVNPTLWKGSEIEPTAAPIWQVNIVTKGNLGFKGRESRAEIRFAFGMKNNVWGICITGNAVPQTNEPNNPKG